MSRPLISFFLILGVIASLFLFRSVARAKTPAPPVQAGVPVVLAGPRMKGDPAAPVKIIEFTDFQCPACARANVIMESLLKQYPGKIFVEHRHFPLPRHPHARRASLYAQCAAAQRKFWAMHDVLFKSQSSWAEMNTVDAYFGELAVSLGMDGLPLTACVNSPATEKVIEADIAEGKSRGADSTPTFLVNGKLAVGAAQLTAAVEAAMGKK